MDFDNIPSLKPFKEIYITVSREKDNTDDKDKKEIKGIDNYLSYKFINDYFTTSKK